MSIENLVEKVFGVELLRDKILDYVIHDGNGISTKRDICSCRLVSKDWLQSTSRCLRKSNKPLIELGIGHRTDGSITEDKMKLDNFVSTFTGTAHMALEEQVPPFKLSPYCAYYTEKNRQILTDFLSRCGSSLVEWESTIQINSMEMFSLPNLSLPNLRSFTVQYFRFFNHHTSSGVHLARDVPFMQQVLNGCTQLEVLKLEAVVPVERLVLPTTIRNLSLSSFLSPLKNNCLELLTRNKLPSLKRLCLGRLENASSDDLVFRILEKFQASLVHFSVAGCSWAGSPRDITYFELPVLKNLQHFELRSRCWGLGLRLEYKGSLLKNKLPKLCKLVLQDQPEMVFRNWVENSKLTTVKSLVVSIIDENVLPSQGDTEYYKSFRSELMLGVHKTFPNLSSLEITVCGTELCGLKYAFQNLKQLQFLAVHMRYPDNIINSDYWDAFLLGIPIELVTALRTTNYWNNVSFKENNSITSIKNLTELKELTMVDYSYGTPPVRLISDAVFQFAFYQMAKLTKLTLSGRFEASPEAVSEWKAKGHKIRSSRWRPY